MVNRGWLPGYRWIRAISSFSPATEEPLRSSGERERVGAVTLPRSSYRCAGSTALSRQNRARSFGSNWGEAATDVARSVHAGWNRCDEASFTSAPAFTHRPHYPPKLPTLFARKVSTMCGSSATRNARTSARSVSLIAGKTARDRGPPHVAWLLLSRGNHEPVRFRHGGKLFITHFLLVKATGDRCNRDAGLIA